MPSVADGPDTDRIVPRFQLRSGSKSRAESGSIRRSTRWPSGSTSAASPVVF